MHVLFDLVQAKIADLTTKTEFCEAMLEGVFIGLFSIVFSILFDRWILHPDQKNNSTSNLPTSKQKYWEGYKLGKKFAHEDRNNNNLSHRSIDGNEELLSEQRDDKHWRIGYKDGYDDAMK